MAKKNLASLMNGIMGDSNPIKPDLFSDEWKAAPVSDVTEEMEDRLKAKRRQNVGRPRKGETPAKPNEVRATFIVDPEVVRKLKYISLVENNLLKDVISTALTAYIASWEAENSKIRLPKIK